MISEENPIAASGVHNLQYLSLEQNKTNAIL